MLPSPSNLGIDPWSNLNQRTGVTGMGSCQTEPLSAIPTTQNQLNGIGMTYDAAGNVINDGNGNQPTYDDENRIVTDAGYSYSYDADGTRIEKAAGSSGTIYWPGPSGALTETDLTGTINEEYIFFNGERIARVDRPSGTVHYYFADKLGSASLITSATGTSPTYYYYFPYGGLAGTVGSDTNHYKLTGKERDSESGLDEFGARYFTSSIGRFMTPDWAARPTSVPYAVFGDPQSLNLYSYVRNDPVSRADADGHCFWCHFGGSDEPESWAQGWSRWFWGGGDFAPPPDLLAQNQAQQQMTTSAAGIAFIEGWESWNGTVDKKTGLTYAKDDGFGNGTIGWGHNCGKCADFKDGITKEQGEALLKSDLAGFEKSVNGLGASLSQQQFDGLVSFAFNVRNYGSSTLFGNVSSGTAVTEANFTAYGHAHVGRKLVEVPSLMARRRSEYNIYANGVYDSSH